MKVLTISLAMLLGPIVFSKRLSIDNNKLSTKKISECRRCKVLTDSFNTWLDKTARGKHEGGDAAWEEKKLKTYARSEMRLVEIQEGLCSDLTTHQNDCYAIAEEAELVLEKWWFHENNENLDLYTWLCIENLQYCCPPFHFGEQCTPCTRNFDNKICSGNGKCDGDGTRKGNGTCICNRGFSGKHCDECATNFYNETNSCKPCHQSCKECFGDGPHNCVQCGPGWSMDTKICVDVNECLDEATCEPNAFCVNTDGSFKCKSCDRTCKTCLGYGPTNCTTCKEDNILWIGKCMDVNVQRELLREANKRAVIYLCLCVFVMILLKKSKHFASFMFVITAIVMYYFEKKSEINLIDIYFH